MGGSGAASKSSSAKAGGGNFSVKQMNLSGSEKQVAWAKDIVKEAFENLDNQIKQREKALDDDIADIAKRHGLTKAAVRKANFSNPNSAPSQDKLWIDTAKEYKTKNMENFKNLPSNFPASNIIDARQGMTTEAMINAVNILVRQKKNKR
jgi:hypothetical protein|nr:MAG TPA: hypothetical protein [Caudoviricetes sp.]